MRAASFANASVTALVTALLVACGAPSPSTSITHVWSASLTRAPMRSVLVIATNVPDPQRRMTEDAFVVALDDRGVSAHASGDVADMKQVDGVLLVTVKSMREERTYVPGTYASDFWGGYQAAGWSLHSPRYVDTQAITAVETSLWDTRGRDVLVWSATTKTASARRTDAFAASVATEVTRELARECIIPGGQACTPPHE